MTNAGHLAAEMLETSAAGYASAASATPADSNAAAVPEGWGSAEWKKHLMQRILELAAAVRADSPALFSRRINWLRRAVKARGASESDLRFALTRLRDALQRELPEKLVAEVGRPIELALAEFDSDIEIEASAIDPASEHGKLVLAYMTTCLDGRSRDAQALVLDAIEAGTPAADIYTRVLLPAQKEIGQLWHLGDVGISDERLVSETTRALMGVIVNRYAPAPDTDRAMLAAAVAGNIHDIGLRALADLFQLDGWRSIYLGANVPAVEIAHAARSFGVRLIVLSATLTTQLTMLGETITKVKDIAAGTKILVGGLALEDSPDLWRELGADAFAADVESAVAIGADLIGAR